MNTNDAVAVLREALESLYQMTSRYAITDTDYGIVCNAASALAATGRASTVAKDTAGEDLSDGYDCGTCMTCEGGAEIHLHYQSNEQAESAFGKITRMATPKPEASAATQQAGGVKLAADYIEQKAEIYFQENSRADYDTGGTEWRNDESRDYYYALSELADDVRNLTAPISDGTAHGCPKDSPYGPVKCTDCVSDATAAPISEDTSEACAHGTPYRFHCDECDGSPMCSNPNTPAAQVSDGDAMPTDLSKQLRDIAKPIKTWEYVQVRPQMLNAAAEEIERYYGGMVNWKRTAEAKDAARTVTGSGGSIGDDAHFSHLMGAYIDARLRKTGSTDISKEFDALCTHIDARTARNAGVAAPDTSARELTDEQSTGGEG